MITVTKEYVDFNGNVYFFDKVQKMPKSKENAVLHALVMFCRSWTFAKMSESEKARCVESFIWADKQGLFCGTYHERMKTANAIYHSFLLGIGYKDSMSWREHGTAFCGI